MQHQHHDGTFLEDESAGYLISVSDMMSGLLFIFIITLMAFVYNFQQAEEQAHDEQRRLERRNELLDNTRKVQRQLLEQIKEELHARGIQVIVVENQGVLRLSEDAIRFRSGSALLAPSEQTKLKEIGRILATVLPCYTANVASRDDCSGDTAGKLESVFIEGHTDNQPMGRNSPYQDNWELSAQRAIAAYRTLASAVPDLLELANVEGEPLFSVAGYGEGRPVNEHPWPTADPDNRRIDLRFIMVSPLANRAPIHGELRAKGLR